MGLKMKLKETMAGFKHHPQLSKCKVKLAYCLLPFGEMWISKGRKTASFWFCRMSLK